MSTNLLLATGHQRHYNILYDDSVDMIRKGLLGEFRSGWASLVATSVAGVAMTAFPVIALLKS